MAIGLNNEKDGPQAGKKFPNRAALVIHSESWRRCGLNAMVMDMLSRQMTYEKRQTESTLKFIAIELLIFARKS
jgi:hypothetical protein